MLLDVTSIAPATILLLDSFFYVVVFHGTTVAQWRKAEYHLSPEHAAFAALLEVHSVPSLLQRPGLLHENIRVVSSRTRWPWHQLRPEHAAFAAMIELAQTLHVRVHPLARCISPPAMYSSFVHC